MGSGEVKSRRGDKGAAGEVLPVPCCPVVGPPGGLGPGLRCWGASASPGQGLRVPAHPRAGPASAWALNKRIEVPCWMATGDFPERARVLESSLVDEERCRLKSELERGSARAPAGRRGPSPLGRQPSVTSGGQSFSISGCDPGLGRRHQQRGGRLLGPLLMCRICISRGRGSALGGVKGGGRPRIRLSTEV